MWKKWLNSNNNMCYPEIISKWMLLLELLSNIWENEKFTINLCVKERLMEELLPTKTRLSSYFIREKEKTKKEHSRCKGDDQPYRSKLSSRAPHFKMLG